MNFSKKNHSLSRQFGKHHSTIERAVSKTKITLFIAVLFSAFSFAQNGINYKAVIKDNLGNVVANQPVTIQFTILRGGTEAYKENHTPTPDANGIIILNIGEGTPAVGSAGFSAINWSNGEHYLNVKVTIAGVLTNMGTTRFKTVPYAISAINATYAANVSGLEAINENFLIGWRLIGRDPALYGNIGVSAVDLSTSSILSSTRGATGDFSIATGFDTTASGIKSTAMGESTLARTYSSTAIGSYNIGSGSSATSWLPTDPLFEIGNGVDIISRSNALTVLKNGNVGIGVANPTAKLHLNGRIKFGNDEYIEDGGSFYIAVNGSLNSAVNGLDNLGSAANRWNTVYATNGVINTSDRRDKANIADMTYGLKDVMKLKPVSFNWKDHPNEDRKLGLIAQDLLEFIPEVVMTHENVAIDENDRSKTKSVAIDRLGVYYSDLIPVLIKAIQEQQTTIENLKARLEALEKN